MKCTICGKEIILVPSAKERAAKYGEKPSYYTNLFKQHSECLVQEREKDTLKLMQKQTASALLKAPWE